MVTAEKSFIIRPEILYILTKGGPRISAMRLSADYPRISAVRFAIFNNLRFAVRIESKKFSKRFDSIRFWKCQEVRGSIRFYKCGLRISATIRKCKFILTCELINRYFSSDFTQMKEIYV